ncbi:MAG: DUF502 domain-containing protein [Alphaproteobacteria bacterium]|nr:DUF502 domain-containing protein [Alphaproteobacteria bacterium]
MTDSSIEPAGPKPPRFHHSLGRRLRGWLVAGILVVVPVALTAYIVWQLVGYFDTLVERWVPASLNPETYLPFKLPGYGVVVVVIGLTLIGAVTASLIGRWAVRLSDRIIARTPIVSGLYGAIKQIVETVLAQKSDTFRQVVLVEYPRPEAWTIAFVCGQTHTEVIRNVGEELIPLYVPTTPNPTSGFLLFVPRRQVKPLKMTVEEALKLIVSLGIVLPPDRGVDATKD